MQSSLHYLATCRISQHFQKKLIFPVVTQMCMLALTVYKLLILITSTYPEHCRKRYLDLSKTKKILLQLQNCNQVIVLGSCTF